MIPHCPAARAARTSAAAVLAAAALVAAPMMSRPAEAKLPGHEYCFHGTCHRVASIAETEAMVGRDLTVSASFYDDCKKDSYNPCGLTSSGETFRPDQPDNAASPIFPDGTTLLLFNPRTKGAAVVRVNNAGPYWGKRKLDVSRAAADKLGFRRTGVAELQVRVVKAPSKAEATYRKNRRYDRVPGFIGQYASLTEAHRGMAATFAIEAMASSLMAPLAGGLIAAAREDDQLRALVPPAPIAKTQPADRSKTLRAKAKNKAKARIVAAVKKTARKSAHAGATKHQRNLADTPVLSRQALVERGTLG